MPSPLRIAELLSCLLAFCLLSPFPLLAQIDPHPTVPESTGVNIHFTDARPGEMKMLAESGVRWVRMDLIWADTERTKGRYDFSAYDRLMATLAPYHLRAMLILDYSNPLYDENRSPYTDEGRQAFAAWAAAAVQHFEGRGVLWEMYNEPNWIAFWRPKPNVDDYIKLALAVGEAITETAPGETYIGPATAVVDPRFLESCFKAGLLNYWSAVTVHPYRQRDPETTAGEFAYVRGLISKYAPKGKDVPIIAGEWGYPSVWNWDGINAGKQADLLAREYLSDLANGVPLTIWYEWRDEGADPKNYEHHFGLTLSDYDGSRDPVYTPKPAYNALRSLTSFFAGCRFSKRLDLGSPADYALLFTKGDEIRLAAWTTGPPHKVVVPASRGRFEAISDTGEKLSRRKAGRHGLSLSLTDAPQYLRPDKPNARRTRN